MAGIGVPGVVLGLLLGLTLGVVVGVLVSHVVSRARRDAGAADAQAQLALARADAAQARTEAAYARTDVAAQQTAQAELRGAVSQARVEAAELLADARAESAAAQAEAAETSAQLARARAERDAALERARSLAEDRLSLLEQFERLSGKTLDHQSRRADEQAEARLRATEQLMAPVRESLEVFNARLTEVEKERAAIAAELRTQVSSVQQTSETLRRETAALVTALRKPQTRGAWGETQLKRVAEIAGMLERCDFDLQATMTNDDQVRRPDMRVNLAEGKHLLVDSKVPLVAYLEAYEAEDEAVRAERLQQFGRNVRTHVDQLSAKQYWKAAGSPEFVVLFLPSEAFFAAALDQVPDLYDYAAARDIVVATPTTLIGLLRAVAYGWRQAALAESAAEVFRLGRELHERLGALGNRFDKLGRALRSTVNAYNETIATAEGHVLVKARQFRDLKVTDRELSQLSPVEEPIRQIQAPELVEDAVAVEPMIGRSRRREQIPEAGELVRPDPDLADLVADDRRRRPDSPNALGLG